MGGGHTSIFYGGPEEWHTPMMGYLDIPQWNSNLCLKLPNKLEYKFAELSLFCQVHFTHFPSPLWQSLQSPHCYLPISLHLFAKSTLLFGYFTSPVCQVFFANQPSRDFYLAILSRLAIHFFVACQNFCPKKSDRPRFLFFHRLPRSM